MSSPLVAGQNRTTRAVISHAKLVYFVQRIPPEERKGGRMEITATELKKNLGHYLELSQHEDVYVSKNGRVVSRLTSPVRDNRQLVESLVGVLPASYDADATLAAHRSEL